MDSYTYLKDLAQNQFPDAKRQSLEEEWVAKRASLKTTTPVKCEWCGHAMEVKNVRDELYLCNKCGNGRPVILAYKRTHKIARLSPADCLAIKRSKTTRLATPGKFFNQTQ